MKAAILSAKNEPLQIREIDDPVPGKGEVMVSLKAAALNHRDIFIRQGLYAHIQYPCIPGSDGAGIIEQTGEGVDENLKGMEVVIYPARGWGEDARVQAKDYKILGMPDQGTLAEKIVVPARYLFEKPGHLKFEEAAALPLAGLTAYRALFSRAKLQPEEKVLITGIGGGVAQMVLQLAAAMHAGIWVTSGSEEKILRARELGAEGGVDYRSEDWGKALKSKAGAFDVIIDSAGGEGFATLIELAAPGGRIAMYGGTRGKMDGISPQRIFWKQLDILGSTMGTPQEFAQMLDFVEMHKIIPEIDSVYPLDETAEAFGVMERHEQMGKLVVDLMD